MSDKKIKEAIAKEISEALEGINGPYIAPEEVILNDAKTKVSITFNVNIVEEDNYIGVCFY